MSRIPLAAVLLGWVVSPSAAQTTTSGVPDLDRTLPAAMQAVGAVGLSAALVVGPEVVWSGAFGVADRERGTPMTSQTSIMLASASKAFTAAALLRLREDAGFELDDDVSRYLPFRVRNPAFPDSPITFRRLLVHTSSIADTREVLQPLYGDGDAMMPLAELVTSYLSPTGARYGRSYYDYAPGEKYTYTNVSFALLGYLVERISGGDFADYCQRTLFEPLGMRRTSWFLRGLDSLQVARHYVTGSGPGMLEPVNHYGWPGYPDGQLRATATDAAHFLAMVLNGGVYQGRRVLRPETVELMFTPQHVPGLPSPFLPTVDLSLPWHINRLDDREIQLHTGRGSGISTALWVDRAAGIGGVLLVTGPVTDREGFIGLIRQLEQAGLWYAGRIEQARGRAAARARPLRRRNNPMPAGRV